MKEENVLRTSIAAAEFEAINQDIIELKKTVSDLTIVVGSLLEFQKRVQALYPSTAEKKSL
jgi:hypothetical protein